MLLVVGLAHRAWSGELDDVRQSVRTSENKKSSEKERGKSLKHSNDHSHDDCDDGNPFGNAIGSLLFVSITAPFWGPYAALEDDLSIQTAMVTRPYMDAPYARQLQQKDGSIPPLFGRIQLQQLSDLDDLTAIQGQVLFETPWRLGVDTSLSRWEERLTGNKDHLWLGDFNLVYRFAESDRWQFRSGIGMNWLNDKAGTDTGFNFTYGVDFYPKRPWVLSTTFDLGNIGKAGLFHNQSTIGLAWDRVEVFTGYDVYRIGRGGDLHGWISGVRLRY